MRRAHRAVLVATLATAAITAACGTDDPQATARSSATVAEAEPVGATETSGDVAADMPSTDSNDLAAPAVQPRDIDATVWTPNGLEVTVTGVEYDSTTASLVVEAQFVNNSRVEESAGTLDLGVTFGEDELRAQAPSKKYPAGGTPVNDDCTVSGLPDDFSLDDASLYFGAADERRSTIELVEGGAVDTLGPRGFLVSGTLTMSYGGTYTVASGQVPPFDCNSGVDSEYLQFVPAERDEFSVVLTGDLRSIYAPAGGYTYTGSTGGFTQLLLPDGTILSATSASTHVFGPNEVLRDSVMCFSGVLAPATGDFELQMRTGLDTTGTLAFSVPPAG